jgi:hypothetical protein
MRNSALRRRRERHVQTEFAYDARKQIVRTSGLKNPINWYFLRKTEISVKRKMRDRIQVRVALAENLYISGEKLTYEFVQPDRRPGVKVFDALISRKAC